jgi:hypothetical protein
MANAPAGREPVIPPDPTAALAATVEGAKPLANTTTMPRADAAEIVTLCIAGGVPAMAANFIAEGATVAQAKERIDAAGEVKNLVALARRKDPSLPTDLAATMLAEGKTVEQARAALFDKLVANEDRTSISSHPPVAGEPARGAPKPVDLVADMKRRHGGKA